MFTRTGDLATMQMFRPPPQSLAPSLVWLEEMFSAKAVSKGGIIRRAVRDVEREIGRAAHLADVRRRGFHLIECGGQFIVICNPGQLQVIC